MSGSLENGFFKNFFKGFLKFSFVEYFSDLVMLEIFVEMFFMYSKQGNDQIKLHPLLTTGYLNENLNSSSNNIST